MQSGVRNIVFIAGGGDCTDIADVLNHCCKSYGHNGDYRGDKERGVNSSAEQAEHGVFHFERKSYPCRILESLKLAGIKSLHNSGEVQNDGDQRGAEHAEHNRDDFDHTLAPDIAYDNYCYCNNRD